MADTFIEEIFATFGKVLEDVINSAIHPRDMIKQIMEILHLWK